MTAAVSLAHSAPPIRTADVGDLSFISATWKQHFWRESSWGARVRWQIFGPAQDKVIRRLLERCQVLVACDPVRPDEILGYLVYSEAGPDAPPALVWAYVKPAFRKAGVFRALVSASSLPDDLTGCEVVQCTRAWFSSAPVLDRDTGAVLRRGRDGLEAKFPNATHNPFRAFEP